MKNIKYSNMYNASAVNKEEKTAYLQVLFYKQYFENRKKRILFTTAYFTSFFLQAIFKK